MSTIRVISHRSSVRCSVMHNKWGSRDCLQNKEKFSKRKRKRKRNSK